MKKSCSKRIYLQNTNINKTQNGGKRMKIKKVLSLACAIAMVAGLATGCGVGNKSTSDSMKETKVVLQRIPLFMEHQPHQEGHLIQYWHIWEVTI